MNTLILWTFRLICLVLLAVTIYYGYMKNMQETKTAEERAKLFVGTMYGIVISYLIFLFGLTL